ncbi:hypothetical protein [Marinobacter sp. BGYM27]|uniref:hypothetical protein n=1 Tax=Marinobacter sp. BGYM27 TaxID=2975597 RepID=UPI0021A7355A|nr:hypothetical protein [Marinobacter sp. BGYM27]MDG5500353.1 hypothetical protein [Marinobacter sp. BGYM27]
MKYGLKTAVFLFALLASYGSQAGLIQYDWKSTGDESVVYDEDSGLEWLSLSETVGESYYEIEDQLSHDGEYTSFRFATLDEVKQLVTNAGSSWGACHDCPDEIAPLESLIQLIGSDYSYGSGISTWGFIESDSNSAFADGVMLSVDYNAKIKQAWATGTFKSADYYSNLGGFLVRAAQVPEPNALLLFLLPLMAMIAIRAKRSKL